MALELLEHDGLLSDVPVPPEARVAHVDHVDVGEHVVHGVALADTSRADDRDDLEVVAARWRSERSELEAAARVLEEDSGIDSADVAVLHEGGCCGCEIGALSLSLGHGTDLPRSFETPLCLGAVRLVLLGVALRLDEMRALEDCEDYALRSLAGDLLEPRHALLTREVDVALEVRSPCLTALQLVDDVLDTVRKSVGEQHGPRGVVLGEAPRARACWLGVLLLLPSCRSLACWNKNEMTSNRRA